MNYGNIYTEDTVKETLNELNRNYYNRKNWEQAYAAVDVSEQQQLGQLTKDYSKQMSQAYTAAQQAKTDVGSSNIGQGYKNDLLQNNREILQQAFDAYRQNYLQNVTNVEQNAQNSIDTIAKAQTEQAANAVSLLNSPYEYLQYLYQNNNDLFTTDTFKSYVGDDDLRSWTDISRDFFDENNKLTASGQSFYSQMLNSIAQSSAGGSGQYPSYGEWLSKNKEDLFKWVSKDNNYQYLKQMTGITDDYTVKDWKYQRKNLVNEYQNKYDERMQGTDIITSTKNAKKLYEDIENDIQRFTELNEKYDLGNEERIKSLSEKLKNWYKTYDTFTRLSSAGLSGTFSTGKDYEKFLKSYSSQLKTLQDELNKTYNDLVKDF